MAEDIAAAVAYSVELESLRLPPQHTLQDCTWQQVRLHIYEKNEYYMIKHNAFAFHHRLN